MTKLYLIIDSCSGEDYTTDEPRLLLMTKDKNEALDFFNKEIKEWEENMEDYDSTTNYYKCADRHIYECTDFDGDTHRIMKLYTETLF